MQQRPHYVAEKDNRNCHTDLCLKQQKKTLKADNAYYYLLSTETRNRPNNGKHFQLQAQTEKKDYENHSSNNIKFDAKIYLTDHRSSRVRVTKWSLIIMK